MLTLAQSEELVVRTLTRCRTAEINATSVARALVAAEADGLKGHGMSRVPSYAAQAKVGKVDGFELHAAVPERQQEGGVPRQPVELGDHQRRAGDLGEMQRLAELRPVRVPPALHLGKAGDEVGIALNGEPLDRLPLRRDPEPARALARRRDPLVADDPHASPPTTTA